MLDKIKNDLTQAMKNRNKFKLDVIRMLKSAISNEAIEKKHDLSDEEIITVIKREVKKRTSSIEEYTKFNKMDVVDSLKKEIEILSVYLPEELSEDKLRSIIDEVINKLNATTIKEMGSVMKEVTNLVGTNADMSLASKIVKEKLTSN